MGAVTLTSCSNNSNDETVKNTAATSGPSNSNTANTNNNNNNNKYFFAEAVDDGIKFTIKVLPSDKRTSWVGIGDSNGSAFIPSWDNRSKDWTGLYPFISSGETRTFKLWGEFNEEVTVTATGGSGQLTIKEGLKPTLTVSNDKITVTVPELYAKSGFPRGCESPILKLEICTSDGNSFGYADFEGGITTLEISGSNYNSIKNTWKSNYSDKQINADVFYQFKYSGSPDEYRLKAINSGNQTPSVWNN